VHQGFPVDETSGANRYTNVKKGWLSGQSLYFLACIHQFLAVFADLDKPAQILLFVTELKLL